MRAGFRLQFPLNKGNKLLQFVMSVRATRLNLQKGNYENDFQATEDDACDPDGGTPLMTGSVTMDINGEFKPPMPACWTPCWA